MGGKASPSMLTWFDMDQIRSNQLKKEWCSHKFTELKACITKIILITNIVCCFANVEMDSFCVAFHYICSKDTCVKHNTKLKTQRGFDY